MKNGKRPTAKQRKLIESRGLIGQNWLVIKDTPDEMEIVHRYSEITRRTIIKTEGEK